MHAPIILLVCMPKRYEATLSELYDLPLPHCGQCMSRDPTIPTVCPESTVPPEFLIAAIFSMEQATSMEDCVTTLITLISISWDLEKHLAIIWSTDGQAMQTISACGRGRIPLHGMRAQTSY